jgi:molybdopterin-binding protein
VPKSPSAADAEALCVDLPQVRLYGSSVPPAYRIAEAAALLGVSDDTVRRWIDGDRLPAHREGGGPTVIDGADLARLATQTREAPEPGTTPSSARNRLTGIVTRVVRDTVMAQVELQAGPFRLVSLMSREAADELGLEIGVRAVATVKATQVSVDVP